AVPGHGDVGGGPPDRGEEQRFTGAGFEYGGVAAQPPHPDLTVGLRGDRLAEKIPVGTCFRAQRVLQAGARAGGARLVGVDGDAGRGRAPRRHRLQHHAQQFAETWLQVRVLEMEADDSAHPCPTLLSSGSQCPSRVVARRRPAARIRGGAGSSPLVRCRSRLVPVARRPARLASMAHYVYVQETSFIRWVLSSGIPSRVNSPGPGQTGRPGRRRAVAVTVGNRNARDPGVQAPRTAWRRTATVSFPQPWRARAGAFPAGLDVSPYVPFSTRSEPGAEFRIIRRTAVPDPVRASEPGP